MALRDVVCVLPRQRARCRNSSGHGGAKFGHEANIYICDSCMVAKEWLAQLGTKPGPEVWRRGVQEDERLGIFFNLVIKEERQILGQTLVSV